MTFGSVFEVADVYVVDLTGSHSQNILILIDQINIISHGVDSVGFLLVFMSPVESFKLVYFFIDWVWHDISLQATLSLNLKRSLHLYRSLH